MNATVTVGHRRFTCLSPTLVRMEYAPDGVFQERRSLIAHEPKQPIPFSGQREDGDWIVLETGTLTVRTRDNDHPMHAQNLEVRWVEGGLVQYWRPGDRDYRNLGGTVRSLDRYGRQSAFHGAHVADLDPPDAKGLTWLAWLDCEVDPVYREMSPDVPEPKGRRLNRHAAVDLGRHDGTLQERSYNCTADARRFSTGVLSRSGYWVLNDSDGAVLDEDGFPHERHRPGAQDWYFFGYGTDYKAALQDFVRVTGPAALPTPNALGLMFSRWPAYDEAEAKSIIAEFERNGYPLSVIVLDMEWHQEGWGHWDWNEALYADPTAFFRWCHERGIHVTLNDHPLRVRSDDSHFDGYVEAAGVRDRVRDHTYNDKTLPVADVVICDKRQARAFLDTCHSPIVEQGIDFWWNDGYVGELQGACGQLVMNKLCFEEIERAGKRGMHLARYGGLGSHRYGGFFTGDTSICWEILALQVEFNIRAAGVGHAWVSHDIGGFCGGANKDGRIDPTLYLRWLQFGVFNPILRFHSAPGSGSRQPWDYAPEGNGAERRWLRVRNSLLPYLYAAGRETWETGLPVVRGLYLEDATDEDAYRFDQFYFGPSLLVAPVVTADPRRRIYLPAGRWWAFESNTLLPGGMEIVRDVPLEEVPVYVPAGSILVRQDPDASLHAAHREALWLDVYPGADADAVLYEDEGDTPAYRDGAFCKTAFRLRQEGADLLLSGELAEGTPYGETRRIRVTLSLAGEVTEASLVNGTAVPATRDEATGRWTLDLPACAADASFTLRIRTKGGIA